MVPTLHNFLCRLQSCTRTKDLAAGRQLHSFLVSSTNSTFQVAMSEDYLIRFFGACGTLLESNLVFCSVSHLSVYTWHAIVSAHVTHGEHHQALVLYELMLQEDIRPNNYVYTCVLKACNAMGAMIHGELIHDAVIREGHESRVDVGTAVVDLYASRGLLEEAQRVFGTLPQKDILSWSALLERLIQNGCHSSAMILVRDIQQAGIVPDKVMFLGALKACGSSRCLRSGNLLHVQIIESGLETEITLANTLVDMYAKCGAVRDACTIFKHLHNPTVVSWGAMMGAYAGHSLHFEALQLLQKMQEKQMGMNEVIFLHGLKACGGNRAIELGRILHHQIIKSGVDIDNATDSALIDMYAKCGVVSEAQHMFDMESQHNVVSWDAMIGGYAHQGCGLTAYQFFLQMQREGVRPETITYLCVLKGIVGTRFEQCGKLIHYMIIHDSFELDEAIGNMLVDMYAKFGSIQDALKMFDSIKNPSEVSWSALMGGYVQHGDGLLGIELFTRMQRKGVKPDGIAYLGVLKACSIASMVIQGRLIHNQVVDSGYEHDSAICNALMEMYVKCQSISDAQNIFDCSVCPDIVSWGIMVSGHALQGDNVVVNIYLESMQHQGLQPNNVIFTSILSACCQIGAVEDGEFYFRSMDTYGVQPTIEHITCIVDLLGGAGYLKNARQMLDISSARCNITGWMSLLTACRTYGNVELGRYCFDKLVSLNPDIAATYVLMFNIYVAANMWEHASCIEQMRSNRCAEKVPGKACIEINGTALEFVVGETTAFVKSGCVQPFKCTRLKEEGYVPQLDMKIGV